VSGMTCDHCTAAIEHAVALVGGVERVRADLASGRWAARNRDIIDLDTADLGLRVLVSTDHFLSTVD